MANFVITLCDCVLPSSHYRFQILNECHGLVQMGYVFQWLAVLKPTGKHGEWRTGSNIEMSMVIRDFLCVFGVPDDTGAHIYVNCSELKCITVAVLKEEIGILLLYVRWILVKGNLKIVFEMRDVINVYLFKLNNAWVSNDFCTTYFPSFIGG